MNCDGCTACCYMFPIPPIGKPKETVCQHCDNGCVVWEGKPQLCHDFECAYFQSELAPAELRPDRCGVIFSKKSDRIFSGVLVSGVPLAEVAKGQVEAFNNQGYSVVLISTREPKPHLMLASGHEADAIMTEYLSVIDGDVQH